MPSRLSRTRSADPLAQCTTSRKPCPDARIRRRVQRRRAAPVTIGWPGADGDQQPDDSFLLAREICTAAAASRGSHRKM